MKFPYRAKIDTGLFLLFFGLSLFGLLMISSASVVISFEHFGSNYTYFFRQLRSFLIGMVILIIFSRIDYRFWRRIALISLLITIILLILVFIPGIGKELGGAHRWIHLGSLFFQPSEIAKLSLILYLAAWFEKRGEGIRDFSSGFLPFIILVGAISFLIIAQPDMGTMFIIAIVAIIMSFVAGATLGHLGLTVTFAAILFLILIKSAPYRMIRFLTFLKPGAEILGAGYHINQALLAIGSGGLFGLGFGQSKQKYLYLPQAHSDSIFAIIAEELGFLRASVVVIAFLYLGWKGFKIARDAPCNFSRFLAAGITSWIVFQAFVNLGAMLGMLPLTGVPLPFISYGGSSLITLLAAAGILLNISKHTSR